MIRIAADGTAAPYLPPAEGYVRSQDMEPLYHINGAAYVLRPSSFRSRAQVLGPRPLTSLMPAERAIDIDDEGGFLLAEALMLLATDRATQQVPTSFKPL